MFHEVGVLAAKNPDVFGTRGAFAQAYSLFNAALGCSTVFGAAISGSLYHNTNWQITCGVMASLAAAVALLVLRYSGNRVTVSNGTDVEETAERE